MISEQFRLASERLIIRPFTESVADAVCNLQMYADQRGKRRYPEHIGPRQYAEYVSGLRMAYDLEEYRLGGFLQNGGTFVANIEMSQQTLDDCYDLSMHTMGRFRGQGFGPELFTCVLPFFKAVGSKGIRAQVKEDNRPSLRMMEKLGYKPEPGLHDGFYHFIIKPFQA